MSLGGTGNTCRLDTAEVFRTACARTVHIQDGVFMFLPKPVASYLISHLFSQ
ncbi:hypothetical protein IE980_12190 [Klebsiella pneumoniae]|uniref:Uncharacterized protein n=1 Tax=Klebsiella pneumoniae TaxID=573 RepID=A0A927E3C0_KLEPN|nr:hypothetical protein [Klebsiella pneumoniae]